VEIKEAGISGFEFRLLYLDLMPSCVKKNCYKSFLVLILLLSGYVSLSQSNAPKRPVPSGQKIQGSRSLLEFSLLLERTEKLPSQGSRGETPARVKKLQSQIPHRPSSFHENSTEISNSLSEVCFTISGRDFLHHSSLGFYTAQPIQTKDGHFIIPGEFVDYNSVPYRNGGSCIKTDAEGNVLWVKLIDSLQQTPGYFLSYFRVLELVDRSLLLLGRTPNKITGNYDLIFTKLDSNGNLLWSKTFSSRLWEGYNGTGDYFYVTDLEQDPADGQVYLVGSHWAKGISVTKLNPADGSIRWSNVYQSGEFESSFGLAIQSNQLLLFNLQGNYNSYLVISALDKNSGNKIRQKSLISTMDWMGPKIYRPIELVVTESGKFLLSGVTNWYSRTPGVPGPEYLSHAEVIELDQNADFENSFVFRNQVDAAPLLTQVSLAKDGSGVFSMFEYESGFTGKAHIAMFKDGKIYHQRKREHINEGIPYEPPYLSTGNGGFVNIKLMGDSTKTFAEGSRIDFYKMHSSDTLGACIGFPDSVTSLLPKYYIPADLPMYEKMERNDLSEQLSIVHNVKNDRFVKAPACQIISHCDSVSVHADQEAVCVGSRITVTLGKNPACGSLIPLEFDSSFVSAVHKLNDSMYSFQLAKSGIFTIHASVMGCSIKKDSVRITVSKVQSNLDLGADTVLCKNNSLLLKADAGFVQYRWQDGTTTPEFKVTQPGKYYVDVTNACGNSLSDTIWVREHPPIVLNLGTDQQLCFDVPATIEAPEGFINYEWSNSLDNSTYNGRSLFIRPNHSVEYRLRAELKPGCFAYDTIQLSISRPPAIELGPDTSICKTATLSLNAGAGFSSYQWSTGSTSSSITVSEKGSYWINAYLPNGCFSSDTIELVEVYELPVPYLGPDRVICEGQPELLQPAGIYANYLWQDASIAPALQVNQPGRYWVRASNSFGCIGTDTLIITERKLPPSDFLDADTLICSYSTIDLVPGRDFSNYKWNTGASSRVIQAKTQGLYWLTVTDEFNCRGTDSILVTTKDCLKGVFLPNAFSPNGDQKNDLFRAQVFGQLQKFELRIFNRFGQLIFETKNPESGWNGTLNGMLQNTGTFFWTCTYQLIGERLEQQKGQLQLIR
jgi:gliding motility-associated-like protein